MYIAIWIMALLGGALLARRGLRRGRPALLAGGVALALFTVLFFVFLSFWGEKLFFDEVGYGRRFWTVVLARIAVLGAGHGLLYRYLPAQSPDGLPGHEGAFLLCSFWLVDNLTLQGRLEEAFTLYDALCGRAGELGLLPEEIDPSTGHFLGNYPQALSHVGAISSGVNLVRALRARRL